MRGTRAKAIRKLIYGEDLSPRARKYFINTATGTISADKKRQQYQQLKGR